MIYGKGGLVWKCGALWPLSGTPAPKHAGISLAAASCRRRRRHGLRRLPQALLPHRLPVAAAGRHEGGAHPRAPRPVAAGRPAPHEEAGRARHARHRLRLPAGRAGEEASISRRSGQLSDERLLAGMEKHAAVDREDRIAVAMAKAGRCSRKWSSRSATGSSSRRLSSAGTSSRCSKVTRASRRWASSAELLYGDDAGEEARRDSGEVPRWPDRRRGRPDPRLRHGHRLERREPRLLPRARLGAGNNLQAANRLVAIGKDEKVTIDIATMPGSVDDRVQRVLIRRARELNALI
jgi:hypothetical protein